MGHVYRRHLVRALLLIIEVMTWTSYIRVQEMNNKMKFGVRVDFLLIETNLKGEITCLSGPPEKRITRGKLPGIRIEIFRLRRLTLIQSVILVLTLQLKNSLFINNE